MPTPRRNTISKPLEAALLLGLLAAVGAVGLQAATQITNFDPPAATVGNARVLLFALTQYKQDADETLPPTGSAAAFQTALQPFVPDPAAFTSRVTGKAFVPNPALSGQQLSVFSDPGTVPIFRDVPASAQTPVTVGFLDSHVERGGVFQPSAADNSRAYARTLSQGVIQYTQDNDEKYPPMQTQAAFQAALHPFVPNPRPFTDPANGLPFVPNPALSGVPISTITDPTNTVVLQTAMPYPSSGPTVLYADGHITPAAPLTPSGIGIQDSSNLRQIGLAAEQYTQDYDEILPTTTNDSTFQAELLPYLRNPSVFMSPGSGLPYVLNPAVSGVSLGSIADPDSTELARDAQRNPDGTFNHLQVDGRVFQDLYFVPQALAVGPDNLSHLLWYNYSQQGALWTLAPGGTAIAPVSGVTYRTQLTVGADGKTRLLSGGSLAIVGTRGALETATQFGPYDGWGTVFFATGPDNRSRLLWRRRDGALALWTLTADGTYQGCQSVHPLSGGTPAGLAVGADGQVRLLWKTAAGDAALWTLNGRGYASRIVTARTPAGYTLSGFGLSQSNAAALLWSDGAGHAVTQTLGASIGPAAAFALPGGGTAAQIAVGASDLRVLWQAPDGTGFLQTLTPAGKPVSTQTLTPYL